MSYDEIQLIGPVRNWGKPVLLNDRSWRIDFKIELECPKAVEVDPVKFCEDCVFEANKEFEVYLDWFESKNGHSFFQGRPATQGRESGINRMTIGYGDLKTDVLVSIFTHLNPINFCYFSGYDRIFSMLKRRLGQVKLIQGQPSRLWENLGRKKSKS